ncbi:MAG: hypothetical protein AUG49_16220 [Catenulispora sp. 13_1_20CM_3_70_7]|nr:MAG: hypothetical protein AUG49_16220 [Catenulispora sp. 13_1_20CM_3_70_7]
MLFRLRGLPGRRLGGPVVAAAGDLVAEQGAVVVDDRAVAVGRRRGAAAVAGGRLGLGPAGIRTIRRLGRTRTAGRSPRSFGTAGRRGAGLIRAPAVMPGIGVLFPALIRILRTGVLLAEAGRSRVRSGSARVGPRTARLSPRIGGQRPSGLRVEAWFRLRRGRGDRRLWRLW